MRRFLSAVALCLGVLTVAYLAAIPGVSPARTGAQPDATTASPAPRPLPEDIELVAALEPFDGCDDLLSYFKTQGLKRVGPYGLNAPMMDVFFGRRDMVDMDAALTAGDTGAVASAESGTTAGAAPAPQARANTAEKAVSGTNVQERGVDEPDIVKTDGEHLVAMSGNLLSVFEVDRADVRRVGSLRLRGAYGAELLLDGDRVLVLAHGQGDGPQPLPAVDDVARMGIIGPAGYPISELTMVDISNPSTPRITSSLTLDGDYVSARLIDGVARVVVRSQPVALEFQMPKAGGLRAERAATRHNRAVIKRSSIDDWLPYAVLTDAASGLESERPLLDCDAVRHPDTFGGFGMVSVLSVDLTAGLEIEAAAGVIGDADTVYASTDNLYVALHQWSDGGPGVARSKAAPEGPSTDLHQFDITGTGTARYVASGSVPGRLLNQWALSEHEGVLRVATTADDTGRGQSSSSVVSLERRGERLTEIGRVDGLGKGEQIYAVRYDGDIGYVVTFRQTDPLYTLDLSDPRRPRVRGELKINGYSAYLHPVGEGRVVGVGQDATKQGRVTGSQVSLFDVASLAHPERLDQLFLGRGSSSVEYDHRAFLFWPDSDTMVIPLQTWTRRPFNGVVVLTVDDSGLRRRGTIQHSRSAGGNKAGIIGAPDIRRSGGAMISRSFVLDDALLTVSEAGVLVSGLDDLSPRGWARFRK